MNLRNGEHGYGAVTKTLHWLTGLAFAAQFAVGYTMDADGDIAKVDCDPAGEDRSGGDTSDAEEARRDRLEEQCEAAQERREDAADDAVGTAWSDLLDGSLVGDSLSRPEAHVLLGLLIIALAAVRIGWRRFTPLPPWDPRLTPKGQRHVHAIEVVLMTLQFAVPITGIVLVAGDDSLLWLHIAGHVAFFAALAVHITLVLDKGLLRRMLPGA